MNAATARKNIHTRTNRELEFSDVVSNQASLCFAATGVGFKLGSEAVFQGVPDAAIRHLKSEFLVGN